MWLTYLRVRLGLHQRLRLRRRVAEARERTDDLCRDTVRLQDMLRVHVAFLDHLSNETARTRDYRIEFSMFYLRQRQG